VRLHPHNDIDFFVARAHNGSLLHGSSQVSQTQLRNFNENYFHLCTLLGKNNSNIVPCVGFPQPKAIYILTEATIYVVLVDFK
jgi:hypothetical protein